MQQLWLPFPRQFTEVLDTNHTRRQLDLQPADEHFRAHFWKLYPGQKLRLRQEKERKNSAAQSCGLDDSGTQLSNVRHPKQVISDQRAHPRADQLRATADEVAYVAWITTRELCATPAI